MSTRSCLPWTKLTGFLIIFHLPFLILFYKPCHALNENSLHKGPHCLFQDYEFTDQPSRSATADISSYKGFAYDGVQLMARSLDRFIKKNQPDVNWDVWRQPSNYTGIISGISFKGMTVRGNNHFHNHFYVCEVIIMANFRI